MANTWVAIVGATGETGSSILEGILQSSRFSIIALTRPESLSKPANEALRKRGVDTVAVDISGPQSQIVAALRDIDVVVVAVSAFDYHVQIPLATAAKAAGVKRFLPCSYTSVAPAGGFSGLRDDREKIFEHIKAIQLPYSIVDIGWWYQGSLPWLPSGKIDYALQFKKSHIAGDGTVPNVMTDKRDIGKYIARITQDDRTMNKFVLAYSECWTTNEIYSLMEKLSGEKLPRNYVPESEIRSRLEAANKTLAADPSNAGAIWGKIASEYDLCNHIRGDNTPESAKSLGYLTSKELYPDFQPRRFEDLVEEVLDGKMTPLYQSNDRIQALMKK